MKENIPLEGINRQKKEITPVKEFSRLPEIIENPYPRIAIGDIFDVTKQFDNSLTSEDVIGFQRRMYNLQEKYAPPGSTFFAISSKDLISPLEELSLQESQRTDKKVAVVHLDRYISPDQNEPPFYRLNISRGQNDTLVSRPGHNVSPEQQLIDLKSGLASSDAEEIIIIDDVIAHATTLIPIIKNIKEELPDINIRVAVAVASSGGEWSGIEKIKETTGIDVEALSIVKASSKNKYSTGMSVPTSRDMTIFGGSLDTEDRQIKSFPHLFPFNIPRVSFMNKDQRFECSMELLDLNIDLVSYLENRLGRELNIQDLLDRGFGVPSIKIDAIRQIIPEATSEVPLMEYLKIIKKTALRNYNIYESESKRIDRIETFTDRKQEIAEMYRQAFKGQPWFEELSSEEVLDRIKQHSEKKGFDCLIEEVDREIAGGLWFDTPTLEQLGQERGSNLTDFVKELQYQVGVEDIVWEREVIVHPDFQGRKIATFLRNDFLQHLFEQFPKGVIMLTRMRDDNLGIVKIAQNLGYQKTGLKHPSSQNPNAHHEYWYKIIGQSK